MTKDQPLPLELRRVKLPRRNKIGWSPAMEKLCRDRSDGMPEPPCYTISNIRDEGPCKACQRKARKQRIPMKETEQ